MESEEEWKFLKSKVNDSQFKNGVRWYIGLRNESDKWCWITSDNSCIEAKFGASRWNTDEPNNRNTEGCVEMLKKGLYNNVPCNKSDVDIGYICEREIDCNTSHSGKIIFKSQSATASKVPNKVDQKATKMMTTNPKTQLTTTTTTTTGKSHETNVFNHTKGAKDTMSNQKKKNQWVTIVMIGVPAAILIVLLILLGCIIKRRMVSNKSEGGVPVGNREVEAKGNYSAGQLTNDQTHPSESSVPLRRTEGKRLDTEFHFSSLVPGCSSTEDNFPGKYKSAPLEPTGESSKMLSEQGNKTDDQKYLYASVDKTRKKKTKAGVHFNHFSGDLVYAEVDFNPSSQDASGAAAKQTPTKVTATVYASIEETCG